MLLNWYDIFSIIYLILEISFKTAMFYALCLYFLIMSPLIKTVVGYMDHLVSYACVVFFIERKKIFGRAR